MTRSIAVVGHGLTPKGKGWGYNIDRSDVVVRMWNYHWQTPKDYGRKYDYGMFEISKTELARFNRHNVRFPGLGWLAFNLQPFPGQQLPEGKMIIVNPQKWVEVAVRMGGVGDRGKYLKLTRGVRAAAWAIEQKPKRVVLVGFDNVVKGMALPIVEGYPPEYVACPAGFPFRDYVGGVVRYSSHDYSVEQPFLNWLALENKVQLVHAQDIWK